MYLSTITPTDASPKNKLYMKPTSNYLQTTDIEGAQPSLKGYQYFNKPNYSNTTEDIEKASPKKSHPKLEKPDTNLQTRDIDGAFPTKTGFTTKRIGTNPLNPVYQLAKFETYEPPAPKFIRDQISVADIPGTKPEVYYKWNTRNAMSIHDIDGAKPTLAPQLNKPNLMDPRDINKGEFREVNVSANKTEFARCTNPLMPEYLVRDKEGNLLKIGNVDGSRPTVAVNVKTEPHKRHLDNSDIDGSSPSTKGLGPVGKKERNYQKKLVEAADIEGAQSGSLKKGISTLRTTNPLDPSYKWQTEDLETMEAAKGRKEMEKVPTDPGYLKNTSKFFGVSNPASVSKSPPRSQSSSRQSGFNINANRFFTPDYANSEIKEKHFKQNAQKFFDNPQKTHLVHFDNVRNPGSINAPKPKSNFIKIDSAEYQKDLNKFYLAEQSRPVSIDKFSQHSEFEKASRLSEGESATKYQFGLARSDIISPGVKAEEGVQVGKGGNNSISRSQRSLLSSAAKSQLRS